jgi:superfamily II DNA helicase RecQ
MQIKLFTIPVTDNGTFLEEMNRFLRGNKILEVENRFVSNERGASWHFCVKYLQSGKSTQSYEEKKKDYKDELPEDVFKLFSQLRILRKQIADDDAVPAYAVCTDHELAQIASLPEISDKSLKNIKGFGDKKFEKYGAQFINWYQKNKNNEKSGKPL